MSITIFLVINFISGTSVLHPKDSLERNSISIKVLVKNN